MVWYGHWRNSVQIGLFRATGYDSGQIRRNGNTKKYSKVSNQKFLIWKNRPQGHPFTGNNLFRLPNTSHTLLERITILITELNTYE